MNPVTKVGTTLIWQGGFSRRMTLWERLLWKLGRLQPPHAAGEFRGVRR